MKKLAFALAAIGALALAVPASAATTDLSSVTKKVIIKHGGDMKKKVVIKHDNGLHRGFSHSRHYGYDRHRGYDRHASKVVIKKSPGKTVIKKKFEG